MVCVVIIPLLRDSEERSFNVQYQDQYFIEINRNATRSLSYQYRINMHKIAVATMHNYTCVHEYELSGMSTHVAVPRMEMCPFHAWHNTRCIHSMLREMWSTQTHHKIYLILCRVTTHFHAWKNEVIIERYCILSTSYIYIHH